MDKQAAIDELRLCKTNQDTEEAHADADIVLCRLLVSLGYKDVVDEYDKVEKWYA